MDTRLPFDVSAQLTFECPSSLIERLQARYAEPHRRYHTWTHVLACLEARRRITKAALPDVDLALLFHDAVYDPFACDNERKSADLLVEEGRRAWFGERVLQQAAALVAATKHEEGDPFQTEEACIVVDADLSILGSDPDAFDAYESQIRCEYHDVDDVTYKLARRRILRCFLARPSIYATGPGRRLWETSARRNLALSIARLEG
jgi:predicted metal-dependent HD superfamily phosphohydrolase